MHRRGGHRYRPPAFPIARGSGADPTFSAARGRFVLSRCRARETAKRFRKSLFRWCMVNMGFDGQGTAGADSRRLACGV